MMDTLKNIVPTPVRLDVGGERLEIKPRAAEHFPAMMEAAAPILAELAAGNLPYALAKNVRAVQALIAVCADKDPSWVAKLKLREQARLFKACWEANAPFFAEEVMPMITDLLESMADVLGPIPSMLWSGQGTASPTSSSSPQPD